MKRTVNNPRPVETQRSAAEGSLADITPRRIGGDDSLENSSPIDARSDEKVIAREPKGNETENVPFVAAANKSEAQGNDDGM